MASPTPLLLLRLLLLLFLAPALRSLPDDERDTLLRLKSHWQNPSSLSSWSASAPHCTAWQGVTCSADGSVSSLSLSSLDISGPVPSFLCSLRNLTILDLSNNYISGYSLPTLSNCSLLRSLNLSENILVGPLDAAVLPTGLTALFLSGNNFSGDVPASFARLRSLQVLTLNSNLLNGSIAAEMGNLSSLTYLTLACNPFPAAPIPPWLGKLKRLRYLWISMANLAGEIPESIGELKELQHLDLARNRLVGTIPPSIWGLPKLRSLYLYNNHLEGELPANISASAFEVIDVSRNRLNGSLPESIGKMENLSTLLLFDNGFSGSVPEVVGRLRSLIDLRLFGNRFTGSLPRELGMHSKLWNLDVPNNLFTGELPLGLCDGGALESLSAFNNNLTGGLPDSLSRCRTLKTVRLSGNGLSGNVSSGLWSIPALQMLELRGNGFSGELPGELPENLTRLDIADNLFTGSIPSSAVGLQYLAASGNRFTGSLPADLSSFRQVQELMLDRNRLSGEIPDSIRSMKSLARLNLSINELSGPIPAELGSLPSLTILDLSWNALSGEIPPELEALKLNYLNLSSNSLTGPIPNSFRNGAYDDSFLGNPELCDEAGFAGLSSCTARERSKISTGLICLVVVVAGITVTTLAAAVFVGFRHYTRKRRATAGTPSAHGWKQTSFYPVLEFDESTILRFLTPDNVIGHGGSGQVYRVPLPRGSAVAVKRIWKGKKVEVKVEREFQTEVEVLGSIRHMNIVKLLSCLSNSDEKLLVYEYMDNGSLEKWLHKEEGRREKLDWRTRVAIAVGAAKGLCYMHHSCSPAVVHRDFKSSNILLDREMTAKVADFGMARMLLRREKPETATATIAGSFGYMAPELAYTNKVSEKVDVYSFGVILLELTTGRAANDADAHGSLVEWMWSHFQEGRPPSDAVDEVLSKDPSCMGEVEKVMKLGLICTGTLPSTRPSMKEVLQVLVGCTGAAVWKEEVSVAVGMQRVSSKRKASSRKVLCSDGKEGDDQDYLIADV